jgi:diguanylate cyclase (GGDEF)-like protein
MDDQIQRRIQEYVSNAYLAASQKSRLETKQTIQATTNRLASQGAVVSGRTVHEIAKIQGDSINALVQAKADALLDAYEIYGAEIDGEILAKVQSLRADLIEHIATKESGLPPGIPAANMFKSMLEDNTGAIVNTIACQIEQRKVAPKLRRSHLTVAAGQAETGRLIDAVTGIFQRGEFDAALAKIKDREHSDLPVSFVMIDLDHFKTFNDTYGHVVGDEILKAVAQKIATVVRGKGEAYRYGGEEISVILLNHALAEASAVAERIRNEIASARIASLPDCPVTASLGVATVPETSETVAAVVADADRAMYEAKNSGRNRVCSAAKKDYGVPVQSKAATKPKNELFRVSFQTQSQGSVPTTTIKVMRVFGSIENMSPSRRIKEYACTLSIPACCLNYNTAVYPTEIKQRFEGYRSFRSTEQNHARVPIHQGDRLQILSVDIAVDHLAESERQKCLEMEVIATAEGDEEVAETRKTVAQLLGL